MNRTEKPKKTSEELVEMLKNEKGVTFKYTSEEKAILYFQNANNYLRTASYRKNYQKYQNGNTLKGKYIDLDFAYLQELSTIDMHLRNIITKMCIDIEHDLKVILLKDLESNLQEDGYTLVDAFLTSNHYIVEKIEAASASPFTGDLIQKYFTVQRVINPRTKKHQNKIKGFDCPIWVLMELLTFGDFIHFYEYYYAKYSTQPISTQMINLVKSLRNGCAHNNCIIADLNTGKSIAPAEINRKVNLIPSIKQNQKKKKLSCRSILEFVCMLYVYNDVVSENVKRNRVKELKDLFSKRIPEKRIYFKKNELICSSYSFVNKIIEHLFEK